MGTGNVIILDKPIFETCIYEHCTAVIKCKDCWHRFQCKSWKNRYIP